MAATSLHAQTDLMVASRPERSTPACVQAEPLAALCAELDQVTGISFSFYTPSGSVLHKARRADAHNPMLAAIQQYQGQILGELLSQAVERDEGVVVETPPGVVHLAVPVQANRHALGVCVGSYVCTEALDPAVACALGEQIGLVPEQCAAHLRDHAEYSRASAGRLAETVAMVLRFQHSNLLKEREITELTTNLLATYEEISLLYKIGSSITVAAGPREIVQLMCTELIDVLGVETMAAVGVNASGSTRSVGGTHIRGKHNVDEPQLRNLYLLYAEQECPGKPFIENHFQERQSLAAFYPGIRTIMIIPLRVGDETLSVLLAINKNEDQEFGSNDAKLVSSIANEAAVQLKNAQLYEDVRALMYSVVRALSSTIDAKDPYTCGHSERVAFLSRTMAERMGMSDARAEEVYLAGVLHDIGKIGIKEGILQKKGRLTDEEMAHIQQHPEIGARILCNLKHLEAVLPAVRHHHEHIDGSGYPAGLKGDAIPLIGRIIAVADGFDAMSSSRPYRQAMPEAEAVAELKRCAGTQYDRAIVEVFAQMMAGEEFHEIFSNMTAMSMVRD